MRALIYTRVSEDRAEGRSVREQEDEARRVCDREGWEVAEVVTDSVGASRHSKGKRTGWDRARKLIESGDVDVLVTWEASRAHRDLTAYADLRDLCVATGTLWSYSGTTKDLTQSNDRFTTGLDALLAEREADQIAERVQRAVRANAIAGRPHGRRLFGYRRLYDPDSGRLLGQEPDPDEAPVVRRIFAEYLAGSGIRAIALGLNEDGITTGTGSAWADTQVRRVLANPAYIARRVHQGEIVGDATWPPLVPTADFDRVAARFEHMAARRVRQAPTARLLTGVARCGECGAKMVVGHDRKKRKVYQCREGFHVARDERQLDAYVTRTVLDYLARIDVTRMVQAAPDPMVAGARSKITAARARLDAALAEFTAGDLTAATLGRIEAQVLTEIAEQEQLVRRNILPLSIDLPTGNLDDWWDGLPRETRREVIGALVASVVIRKLDRRGRRTFDPDGVELEWRLG